MNSTRNVTSSCLRAFVVILVAASTWGPDVLAGAHIDLRPTPPVPENGYLPNSIVRVDVYFVDTGNPQGDIAFRGLGLDFTDTPPWADNGSLTFPDNQFSWVDPLGFGSVFPNLPNTAVIWTDGPHPPGITLILPEEGEVNVGHVNVNVGDSGGIVDIMNSDEPDPNQGAWALFGFGAGPNDPVTQWRAYTGELTDGTLELPVVPEPGTVLLLGLATAVVLTTKARRTRRKRGDWCELRN